MFDKVLKVAKKVNPYLIGGTVLICLLNGEMMGAIVGIMLLGLIELGQIRSVLEAQ